MHCFLSTRHFLLILIPFEEPPHLTADTIDPTEKLEVNGNINITTGNDYKINGTAIVHSYDNGTNITIDGSKNINLNSPLVGITDIQNTGDIVFTRNGVQICRIQNGGIQMVNNKKFYGEVVGDVKPYLIENINDFDQPIVSYQARTASTDPILPGQYQLLVPSF